MTRSFPGSERMYFADKGVFDNCRRISVSFRRTLNDDCGTCGTLSTGKLQSTKCYCRSPEWPFWKTYWNLKCNTTFCCYSLQWRCSLHHTTVHEGAMRTSCCTSLWQTMHKPTAWNWSTVTSIVCDTCWKMWISLATCAPYRPMILRLCCTTSGNWCVSEGG